MKPRTELETVVRLPMLRRPTRTQIGCIPNGSREPLTCARLSTAVRNGENDRFGPRREWECRTEYGHAGRRSFGASGVVVRMNLGPETVHAAWRQA